MWVFGMVDTSHQPALGYMRIVQDRTAATLLPIIQQHVAQGTVVHSDEWRSYSQVAALPPVQSHLTVNHSVTFVDPTTGAHTQHVESYWNRAKLKLKRMKGCHSDHIAGYLDEFMWRERLGKSSTDAWNNIILDIAPCVDLIKLVTRLLIASYKIDWVIINCNHAMHLQYRYHN